MDLNRLEKINLEKRRRHQVYTTLDYLISGISYFDFFSSDTFEIAKNSKYFAQICSKKNVPSEFLLFAFFHSDLELLKIFKEFKITKKRLARFIMKNSKIKIQKNRNFNIIFNKIKSKNIDNSNDLEYSYEVNKIFEKAAENALTRFKTPVINPSILLLTILEDEKLLACKMLKHIVKNDVDWYLLRYKILKSLHLHESTIRSNIVINQHYFAYLLKTQLTDKQFTSLIKKEMLKESVALFRNDLVSQSLKINLLKLLKKDIKTSMKLLNNRKYSV